MRTVALCLRCPADVDRSTLAGHGWSPCMMRGVRHGRPKKNNSGVAAMRNPVIHSFVLPPRVMTRAARAVYSLLVAAALIAPTHVLAAAASPEPASVPVSLETDDVEMDVLDEIVVYGTDGKVVEGLYAEAELGEADVAAYGADTVGDLIAQVAP